MYIADRDCNYSVPVLTSLRIRENPRSLGRTLRKECTDLPVMAPRMVVNPSVLLRRALGEAYAQAF